MTKENRENTSSSSNRHILVVGGAGYIGSVLTRRLISNSYHVRVLDNLIYDNGSSISDLMEEKLFSFVYGDFGSNRILDKAMESITDVVLLAALVGDPICKKYPELAKKTNLESAENLLRQMNGREIDRFVFTSTCSNYGLRTDDNLATEESELNPQSLYAETKVAFEKNILAGVHEFDFSPTILRLSTAFGISNRMRFDLTISEFTKDLALGRELIVYDENTWRPYCNVFDISNAIIRVLESPKNKVKGEVFNIGSNENNYTKKMILDLIGNHIKDAKIEFKEGGFDTRNYKVSFEKAAKVLDFEALHSANESIEQIINAIDNKLFTDIDSRRHFYGNYHINL